jgi:hypothetical protein
VCDLGRCVEARMILLHVLISCGKSCGIRKESIVPRLVLKYALLQRINHDVNRLLSMLAYFRRRRGSICNIAVECKKVSYV